MKHIILYGHLAKKFGRHHYFDVRTPAEAVRALKANFPGFAKHMVENSAPGYHVRVGKEYRDEEGLAWPVDGSIKIIPAVAGASGLFKAVLGISLIFASMAMPGSSFLLGALGEGGLIMAAGAVGNLGLALTLGGISQVLFQPPAAQSVEAPENQPSYAFDGPVNTVAQGNPIPICYGELMIGSQVVSASLDTGDIAI